jgi:hypothetical protein
MIYRTQREDADYYITNAVTTTWTITDIEHEGFKMD